MAEKTIQFRINGMTCASCEYHARKSLEKLEGVIEVDIDSWHKGNTHLLINTDTVTQNDVATALGEVGYSMAQDTAPNSDKHEDDSLSPSSSKRVISSLLLILMVGGFIIIAETFANNRQSLPINIGYSEANTVVSTSGSILPVISTDNPPDDMSFLDIGETPIVNAIGEVHIPDPEKAVTVFLAGLSGCSTCGIESQYLSNILADYGEDNLRIVFVDVYNWSGSDNLAWFANAVEATNLTWAIDTTGTFRDEYTVDIDSTVIMNRNGEILYRDDFVTEEETLREQISLALEQSVSSIVEPEVNAVQVSVVKTETVILKVISTDQADEIIPPMALNYDLENSIDVLTWDVEIPNSQMPITVFLAGTTGCSTCAIEAQALQQIADELDNSNLEVIVVDIYPYAGAEGLAWFAGAINATNLTWAMDPNNTFMNLYQVALDSTLIMDSTGVILYRDDIITSVETLREQIVSALDQST